MDPLLINVPRRLTLVSHVESLGIPKLDLGHVERCDLRFSDCTFGEPLPMMLLATQFQKLVKKFPDIKYRLLTKECQFRGYAEHIGFFRFLGFARGNRPGEAFGSSNYTPIELLSIRDFVDEVQDEPIGKAVLPMSRRLASILSQEDEGPLFDLFEYSFREIIRNSIEHSKGKKLAYFGQFWPMKGEAEIVVMDSGVGVAENLYDNEYIDCNDNREALQFALFPGVSGVSRSERAQQDERWGNSGFGLYVTSRICSESGLFRIMSGANSLTLANGVRTEHDWSFSGTCVQMKFSTRNAAMTVRRIEEIIAEGKVEWGKIIGDFPIAASAASRMLSSHFEQDE